MRKQVTPGGGWRQSQRQVKHTWLTGVSAVKISDEGRVQDVSNGNPAPLLRVITLPVNQVLETTALWSNPQEASHRVRWLAIDDTGGGMGLERRHMNVRQGLNPGHVNSWVNTEGKG
jgi:hypothetical protein